MIKALSNLSKTLKTKAKLLYFILKSDMSTLEDIKQSLISLKIMEDYSKIMSILKEVKYKDIPVYNSLEKTPMEDLENEDVIIKTPIFLRKIKKLTDDIQ